MKDDSIYMKRRKSRRIYVGKIPIGNNAPISVQSMTNTHTSDIKNTIQQINSLKKFGADIVRISIPTMEDAIAFKKIKKNVDIPLIADIHFDYRIAIKSAEYGADCLRINPGNIGNEKRIRSVIDCAKYNNIPIRIGVNSGSLEKKILKKYKGSTPNALLESALNNINILERYNFENYKISIKSSDVSVTIKTNKLLLNYTEQPLHIGITESGTMRNGIIKSAIGVGLLLYEGIGDTLRISLSAHPTEEVLVGYRILQALNLKKRGINFISCPTCSRQEFDVIKTVNLLEKRLEDIEVPMDVSIIGCVVNGLGEALSSTIGITGYRNTSSIYEDGIRKNIRIDNERITDQLEQYIRKKAEKIKKNKNFSCR